MTEQSSIPLAADVLHADGATCATLTPLIRAKIRELESGSVLEVRTDDPSAHEGIAAWSRLTGNELLGAIDEGEHTRFYLRKK
jgi:TusA-related sulfurtransferase